MHFVLALSFLFMYYKTVLGCTQIHTVGNYCDSDLVIVGLVNFREKDDHKFYHKALTRMEAVMYAVQEANKMFPNITIGYVIYDTCRSRQLVLEISSAIVLDEGHCTRHKTHNCSCISKNLKKIIGVVGAEFSSHSQIVSTILSAEKVPVISALSTSVRLSDKYVHPYFLRTVAPDNYQAEAMTQFVLHHKWTYITLISLDNEYGEMGRRELHERFTRHKICFDVEIIISPYPKLDETNTVVRQIKEKSKTSVVILWMYRATAERIFMRANEQKLFNITWIAAESVGFSKDLFKLNSRVIDGLILTQPYGGVDQGFGDYFFNKHVSNDSDHQWERDLFDKYKEFALNDSLRLQHIQEIFFQMTVPHVTEAVNALTHALKDYVAATNKTAVTVTEHRDEYFHRYLKRVSFKSKSQDNYTVAFDANGDIMNQQFLFIAVQRQPDASLNFTEVAVWSREKNIQILHHLMWDGYHNTAPKAQCSETCLEGYHKIINDRSPCCWTCVPCKENHYAPSKGLDQCEVCPNGTYPNSNRTSCLAMQKLHMTYDSTNGIVTLSMTLFGSAVTLSIIAIYMRYRDTPIIRSSHFSISITELVSHLALFLTLSLYVAPPTTVSCMSLTVLQGGFFTLALSLVLVKAELLLHLFKLKKRIRRRHMIIGCTAVASTITMTLLFQTVIIALSYILVGGQISEIHETTDDMDTVSCNHGTVIQAQMFYYIMLSLLCGVQAYRARRVPEYYFDSSSMSTASFASFAFLLTWIPLYFSLSSTQDRAFITGVMLFTANIAIVVLMYGWRVYVAMFNKEKNSKVYASRITTSDNRSTNG